MDRNRLYVKQWRLIERLKRRVSAHRGRKKTTYVWDRVPYYRKLWQDAAIRNNLRFFPLSDDVWELRDEANQCVARINNCYVELDNPVTLHVAGHKALTYQLLSEAGLSIAPHAVFTPESLSVLEEFVGNHDGPFVIKPASGTGSGIGVTTHLYTFRECLKATALASLFCTELLVEQFIAGEVYRLLFVNGECISGVRRNGLRVEGDGKSSVAKLVMSRYPELENGWRTDLDLRATTEVQGISPATVLDAGKQVLIKSVGYSYQDNLQIRTEYAYDVTSELCAGIIDAAKQCSRILRSEHCGVDLILLDPSKPLRNGNGVIGEINTTPGLHHHYDVVGADQRRDAADAVIAQIKLRAADAR